MTRQPPVRQAEFASSISYQQLSVSDVPAALDFLAKVVPLEEGMVNPAMYVEDTLTHLAESEFGVSYTAKHGKELAGLSLGQTQPAIETGEIFVVAVDPRYRHQGIGTELMNRELTDLGLKGCKDVLVTLNTMYKSLGLGFFKKFRLVTDRVDSYWLARGVLNPYTAVLAAESSQP